MMLSAEDSAEKGSYHTDRAPYQKDILDACTDRRIQTVVIMSSAQVGKTLLLKTLIGYHVHQSPIPMLLIQPTLDMAESFSKDRLSPMVRDTPVLRGLIKEAKARSSGNTILHKKFPGGHITMAGANSPASLASRPVGLVMFDEPDRYPASAGTEGDPCELGERRTDGFPYPKSIYFSTPTIEGASKISEKFDLTDKRKFFVPCPHCGEYQALEWEGIKWDEDKDKMVIADSVRYTCEHCTKDIYESKKSWMILNGEWKATVKPKRPGFTGFYINSLYSPFKSWTDRIYIYKSSRATKEMQQVFWNTILGRLWVNKGESPDWEKIYGRREFYQMNRIPLGASIILAGADIQDDRIEVEIRAYGPMMESWSIDYRKLIGPVMQEAVWRKLDELLNEEFHYTDGGTGKIFRLAIDTGYATSQVYNFARRWGSDRVLAVKGSSQRFQQMLSTPRLIDKDSKGNKMDGGVYLYTVGTDVIKSEIYNNLKQLRRGIDVNEKVFGTMHFPDYPEDYFKQLTAESLVVRVLKSGQKQYSWILPPGHRNEVLDTNVYCRACAASVGVDRWTEQHHEKFIDMHVQQSQQIQKQTVAKKKSGLVGKPIRYD